MRALNEVVRWGESRLLGTGHGFWSGPGKRAFFFVRDELIVEADAPQARVMTRLALSSDWLPKAPNGRAEYGEQGALPGGNWLWLLSWSLQVRRTESDVPLST